MKKVKNRKFLRNKVKEGHQSKAVNNREHEIYRAWDRKGRVRQQEGGKYTTGVREESPVFSMVWGRLPRVLDGPDDKMRSAPVLETRGRWSLLRAAGPTTQDKLARGTAGDCCYTFVAICRSLEERCLVIPIEGVGTAL